MEVLNQQYITMKKYLGNVAVDSGQVIIVDPCYLGEWKDGDFKSGDNSNHYSAVCNITLKDSGGEILVSHIAGTGVASQTFQGDGSYPVYADTDKQGRVKSLTIQFT